MFRQFTRDEAKLRNSTDHSFVLNGRVYHYAIDNGNLHIVESHTISKRDFAVVFDLLRRWHPNCQAWKRRDASLRREWATHNLCYDLHFRRDLTADVDLNYPVTFWVKVGYGIVGTIALILIK